MRFLVCAATAHMLARAATTLKIRIAHTEKKMEVVGFRI